MRPPTAHDTYDPTRIMGDLFLDSCFLLDVFQDGKIISARSPYAQMNLGASFWQFLSPGDKKSIRQYLKDYREEPVMMESRMGIAILLPLTIADASLALVVIPHMPKERLLDFFCQCVPSSDLLWSDSLYHQRPDRSEKKKIEEDPELRLLWDQIRGILNVPMEEWTAKSRLLHLYNLSCVSGCPLSDLSGLPTTGEKRPNLPIFSAASLLSLLYCRRAAIGREVYAKIEADSVLFHIPLSEPPALEELPEGNWLTVMAESKCLTVSTVQEPPALRLRALLYAERKHPTVIKQPYEYYGFWKMENDQIS